MGMNLRLGLNFGGEDESWDEMRLVWVRLGCVVLNVVEVKEVEDVEWSCSLIQFGGVGWRLIFGELERFFNFNFRFGWFLEYFWREIEIRPEFGNFLV